MAKETKIVEQVVQAIDKNSVLKHQVDHKQMQ
jgi:hypothetical protein